MPLWLPFMSAGDDVLVQTYFGSPNIHYVQQAVRELPSPFTHDRSNKHARFEHIVASTSSAVHDSSVGT